MKYLTNIFYITTILLIEENSQAKVQPKLKELEPFLAVDACRERQRLLTTDRNEEFELVETCINSTLTLACHYCDDIDDNVPKLWYFRSRFSNDNVTEVEIGLNDELSSNRIYMTPDHTLVFNQVVEEDAAFYYCSGRLGEDKKFKYNYLVDIVNKSAVQLTVGDKDGWALFQKKSYIEINKKFATSTRSDYVQLRSKGIIIEVIGKWLPWSLCDGCKKIRFKYAECRLQPSLKDNNDTMDDRETILVKSFEMSCYSLALRKYYPEISDDIAGIGNYAITESCYAPCRVVSTSNSTARYKNTVLLAEGDHFTLICPEVTLDSEVTWEKNRETISPDIRKGNIILDSFSNLYIISATSDEEGNYTCYVNDIRMQDIVVIVRKEFIMTSEAFIRHLKYLGFIFIFSGIFYTAGMILSWNKRHTYKKIDFAKYDEERFSRYLPGYYGDEVSEEA